MNEQRHKPSPTFAIIGGGPGGYEAALSAAVQGANVTLISNDELGGNSVLYDCVPSKALITYSVNRYPGEERPQISEVMTHIQQIGAMQSQDIANAIAAHNVKVIKGHGSLIDSNTVRVIKDNGMSEVVRANFVIIATGSNPRSLPFAKPDGKRIFTSRELSQLQEWPERLIVIGSGVTGAEYAQAFSRLGVDVHLISSRNRILPYEDELAAHTLQGEFERFGITTHSHRRANDIMITEDGVRVLMVAGSKDVEVEPEWLEGTHVLLCVGMVANTRGLSLENCGIVPNQQGFIEVDDVSRTDDTRVYAVGDVTGRGMLASIAATQGRIATYHALGLAVEPIHWNAIASCIFTTPQVSSIGLSHEEIEASGQRALTQIIEIGKNPRSKMEGFNTGFVKIHAIENTGQLMGATIVAPNASDLIMPLAVAIQQRMNVREYERVATIYPSLSGTIAEAARRLLGYSSPLNHR